MVFLLERLIALSNRVKKKYELIINLRFLHIRYKIVSKY